MLKLPKNTYSWIIKWRNKVKVALHISIQKKKTKVSGKTAAKRNDKKQRKSWILNQNEM